MLEKPLFVPLMRKYYEQFVSGEKKFEYRKAGGPWNERTCRIGRLVTISMGYGKQHRRSGVITSFDIVPISEVPSAKEVYEDALYIAKIGIQLEE
jgi:hypothetical protein